MSKTRTRADAADPFGMPPGDAPALVLEGLGALERLDDRVLEESMRSTTPALVH